MLFTSCPGAPVAPRPSVFRHADRHYGQSRNIKYSIVRDLDRGGSRNLFWGGPNQGPQLKVEGEARIEGAKRPRIEGEARTEGRSPRKKRGEGSGEGAR